MYIDSGKTKSFEPVQLNSLQPVNNQILVQTSCQNIPVNLFIDTGASISLVSTRFIEQANLVHQVAPTKVRLTGLGTDVITPEGEIMLPISLGNCTTSHIFIVYNNVDNEFLIGLDLLEKINARIDLPQKKLITADGEVDFFTKPKRLENRLKIRCNKNITLPAHSTGYLWGKIPIKNAKSNYEGVIERYDKLAVERGVFVTGTLSYSSNNLVPIHYVNVMSQDVTIYRNQLVAFMEPLENEICTQGVHKVLHNEDFKNDVPRLPDADPVEVTIKKGRWEIPEDLHTQLQIDEMSIPQSSKKELKDLITEYSHCFSKNKFDLGEASFYKVYTKIEE